MRFKIRKGALKAAFLTLFIVGCALLCLSLIRMWETNNGGTQSESSSAEVEEPQGQIYFNGTWYISRQNLETVLFLGLDEFSDSGTEGSYNNSRQADFILLLLLDHERRTVSAMHLNRDTMTDIQILGVTGEPAGAFVGQLALAHTYGDGGRNSCLNTAVAVSNLLYGVEIDHYVSLTMDAVPILNDMVGGVPVTVLDDFTAIDPELAPGDTVLLRGEQALAYVRTRRELEDSSNLHRMERQRQYMSSFLEQFQSAIREDQEFLVDAVLSIEDCMVSDCTVEQLSGLAENIQEYQFNGVRTSEGEAVQGEEYMEFHVDEEALQALVTELFYQPQPQKK